MSAPLNTAPREGWRNKHTDPMPTKECNLMVFYHQSDYESGGGVLVGRWLPNEDDTKNNLIGTFLCIGHYYPYNKFGLHAWRGNDHEFTYYKVL